MDDQRMILLGYGTYARADRIYALEPLPRGERGDGRRTRVWVDGIAEPLVASRSESAILRDLRRSSRGEEQARGARGSRRDDRAPRLFGDDA